MRSMPWFWIGSHAECDKVVNGIPGAEAWRRGCGATSDVTLVMARFKVAVLPFGHDHWPVALGDLSARDLW